MAESGLPSSLTLRVGEQAAIVLPSLAGAGYLWEYELADVGVVQVRKQLTGGGTAAGSPTELLQLRGQSAGRTRLMVRQRRSWEPTAVREQRIRVHVLPADAKGVAE